MAKQINPVYSQKRSVSQECVAEAKPGLEQSESFPPYMFYMYSIWKYSAMVHILFNMASLH